MVETQILTIEDKRAYVDRIEKKASDENISLKQAVHRLGGKIWAYNKYKSDLRLLDANRCRSAGNDAKVGTVEEHRTPMPKSITLTVSDLVYSYLESESKEYATSADIVAQLLLHDCVKGKMASKAKPEVKQ